jgi:hypothetical protein
MLDDGSYSEDDIIEFVRVMDKYFAIDEVIEVCIKKD